MTGVGLRRVIICAALLLSAVLVCVYFARGGGRWRQAQATIEAAEVTPYLKDGDVICRLGDKLWSSFVKNMSPDDRRFSHLGIVRVRNGSVSVINAECLLREREERVNEVSLPEFLKVAKAVGVYRANFINGTVISEGAARYLGRPFDWKFDSSDDAEIYCTELLHAAIKNAAPEYGLESKSVRGFGVTVIPLEAVSKSKDFDEVAYIDKTGSQLALSGEAESVNNP